MPTHYVLTGKQAGSDDEDVVCTFFEEPDEDDIRDALAEFVEQQLCPQDYKTDEEMDEHIQFGVDGYFDALNGGYVSIDEVEVR